jgi:hypothetical protein
LGTVGGFAIAEIAGDHAVGVEKVKVSRASIGSHDSLAP